MVNLKKQDKREDGKFHPRHVNHDPSIESAKAEFDSIDNNVNKK